MFQRLTPVMFFSIHRWAMSDKGGELRRYTFLVQGIDEMGPVLVRPRAMFGERLRE